ncbi:MAG: hypothetical protein J7493_11890 [Porphyrobacter sp.]|nr:hypothetical protein [Porphyrobacter sp.]
MAERLTRQVVAEKAIVLDEPALRLPTSVDRTFELPAGLYVATAAAYFGFLGVMALGFGNPGLIVPMAIFIVFVAMFFAVPAMWMKMGPLNPQQLTSWSRFQQRGVMTPYGRSTAGAATVQVLILPGLILLWGLVAVIIAAVVR